MATSVLLSKHIWREISCIMLVLHAVCLSDFYSRVHWRSHKSLVDNSNSYFCLSKQRWRTDRCWLWKTAWLVEVIYIRICICIRLELERNSNKLRHIPTRMAITDGLSRNSTNQLHCGIALTLSRLSVTAIWSGWNIVRHDAICILTKNRPLFLVNIIRLLDMER